jgi:hypothetical protein
LHSDVTPLGGLADATGSNAGTDGGAGNSTGLLAQAVLTIGNEHIGDGGLETSPVPDPATQEVIGWAPIYRQSSWGT